MGEFMVGMILWKFNWVSQFNENFLKKINMTSIWDNLDPNYWSAMESTVFSRYAMYLKNRDIEDSLPPKLVKFLSPECS